MVERKAVIEGLKIGYNGLFELNEFYRTVEDWRIKQGREKQILKKLEHAEKTGKDIEWFMEFWKMTGEYAKPVVRIRALFTNIANVNIKKDGYTKTYQKGEAVILLDGILETLLEGRWTQRPLFVFFRTLFDKYLHKYWTEKFDAQLKKDTMDLHRHIEAFFSLYKYYK